MRDSDAKLVGKLNIPGQLKVSVFRPKNIESGPGSVTRSRAIRAAERALAEHKAGKRVSTNAIIGNTLEYDRDQVFDIFKHSDDQFVAIPRISDITPEPNNKKKEGHLKDPQEQLIERVRDRPDLAIACLKFLDKAVTRPEYAKLSAELTEDRLAHRREQERQKKARYRQKRQSALATGSQAMKP